MFDVRKRRGTLTFPVGNSGQSLKISPKALGVFKKYRQINLSQPESGGLLFARFDLPVVEIVTATVPQAGDKRSRFLFECDQHTRRKLIQHFYRKDLHFIGEWHTHPQAKPHPSSLDIDSMKDLYQKSKHNLNFFIMAIVGNRTDSLSLWVSLHDGHDMHRLSAMVD